MTNPMTGNQIRKTSPIVSVAMTRDGKHFAVARLNKTVEIWSVGGELLHWHKFHCSQVETVVVSDNGKSLVSISSPPYRKRKYREVILCNVEPTQVESVPCSFARMPVFVPNSQTLVVADQCPVFYDMVTGREAKIQIDHDAEDSQISDAFAFSAVGELFASTTRQGQIRVLSLRSLKTTQKLDGHAGIVDLLAFSSDGSLLASAGHDETVRIWDIATGKIVRQIDVEVEDHFHFTYLAERCGWLLVDRKHGLRVFGIRAEDDCDAILPQSRTINAVGSGAEGGVLIIGREDGIVYLGRTADLLHGNRPSAGGEDTNRSDNGHLDPMMKLILPRKRKHLRLQRVELEPSLFQQWRQHTTENPDDSIDTFFMKNHPEAKEDEIRKFHAHVAQIEVFKGLFERLDEASFGL